MTQAQLLMLLGNWVNMKCLYRVQSANLLRTKCFEGKDNDNKKT